MIKVGDVVRSFSNTNFIYIVTRVEYPEIFVNLYRATGFDLHIEYCCSEYNVAKLTDSEVMEYILTDGNIQGQDITPIEY